jgi:hypothetical protein
VDTHQDPFRAQLRAGDPRAGPACQRAAGDSADAGRRSPGDRWRAVEYIVATVLGLLVAVVHNLTYLLRAPYWTDESWVAITTRYPLSDLMRTTSSTPVGWSFLLRLVSFGQSQTGRLLPLAFAGLAVVVAYWLARRLDWKRRDSAVLAAVLAGAGVLLAPAMLARNDLKQYTADACVALVILAVTSRLERQWSWRNLILLSACVWGGMLLSNPAAFVGAAALGAVCLVQLARRAWRRLAEAAIVTVGTGALAAGVYALFDARAVVPLLTLYWHSFYLPVSAGARASAQFVTQTIEGDAPFIGLGHWWIAIPLVVAGLVTLVRLGRPATAVACIVLWPEMLALSALRKYPFMDLRTSTFLITATVVVAAIGVAGICAAVCGWLGGGNLARATAVVLAAAALASFVLNSRTFVRSQLIPVSYLSAADRYLAGHRGPHDPVIVSAASSWDFAYYWPSGQPGLIPNSNVLQSYQADFPDEPYVIIAAQRDEPAIRAALRQALAQIRPGACGRIWLVLQQLDPLEDQAYPLEIHALKLTDRPVVPDLYVINVGPRSCR